MPQAKALNLKAPRDGRPGDSENPPPSPRHVLQSVHPAHFGGTGLGVDVMPASDLAASGIVTGLPEMEPGGGPDPHRLLESLANHQRSSYLLVGDREMASAEDRHLAKEAGAKQVAIPHLARTPPKHEDNEKQRQFRRAYRFQSQLEEKFDAIKRGCYRIRTGAC